MKFYGVIPALLAGVLFSTAQSPTLVRTTDPLTPSQEAKTFLVPAGFRIQLFAAEPQINKPMNLAFDSRGRVWVTSTVEYPYAVKTGQQGRDSIKILEDTTGDGRANKVTTFVDGLNIPTGLYPYRDGVIAWSIPNIWFFRDTDGDGRADKREKLLGPLGYERDTHGMSSSFTRSLEGWLHITHGFNNHSMVRGRDGSELTMHSGNTWRSRLDGSRVEPFTWGQVNPFGMCVDPRGYLYTADCHSSPVYQLIPGAYYPSFGKPHDGLGYAPRIVTHTHGSTGIAGVAYYADNLWPANFRDNIFLGNVVTSRVNRDRLTFNGSSPHGAKQPDFLTSKDPWFRPVDLQFGPDGALYIADFYNRIIGHYEVPLDHPGRDRTRGRIWRVTYQGKTHPPLDLTTPAKALAELGHANFTRRQLATDALSDLHGPKATAELQKLLEAKNTPPTQQVHAMWALHRLDKLDNATHEKLLADKNPFIRTHAIRALAKWNDRQRELAFAALNAHAPHVRRAAAEAIARHPAAASAKQLLEITQRHILGDTLQVGGQRGPDTHFVHALRIALRNHLREPDAFLEIQSTRANRRLLIEMALAIEMPQAAEFLLEHLPADEASAARAIRRIARYAPANRLGEVVALVQMNRSGEFIAQAELLRAMLEGLAERGEKMPEAIRNWGTKLVTQLLSIKASVNPWTHKPLAGSLDLANPWAFQERRCADGIAARLMSSHPRGEQRTGIYRSRPFALPPALSLFLAGHDGVSGKPPQKKNAVRLRDAATGKVLHEAFAPRSDTARKITWPLAAHKGKRGYLEATDADPGSAYAWLAFGRIQPAVPEVALVDAQTISHRQVAAAELTRDLQLKTHLPQLSRIAAGAEPDARAAAFRALLAMQPDAKVRQLAATVLTDAQQPETLRETIAQSAAGITALQPALTQALTTAPAGLQTRLARALAGQPVGMKTLLTAIEQGRSPALLLRDSKIKARLNEADAKRAAALTTDLPPANESTAKLIAARLKFFGEKGGDVRRGAEVFKTVCAVCHAKGGQGGNIGPQLDGLAARGAGRLVEDLIDPNRNVDMAFRYSIVKMKNGQTMLGLKRREVGQTIMFADLTGKETSVPKTAITSLTPTVRSLMPEGFAAALPEKDFAALLAFLLAK